MAGSLAQQHQLLARLAQGLLQSSSALRGGALAAAAAFPHTSGGSQLLQCLLPPASGSQTAGPGAAASPRRAWTSWAAPEPLPATVAGSGDAGYGQKHHPGSSHAHHVNPSARYHRHHPVSPRPKPRSGHHSPAFAQHQHVEAPFAIEPSSLHFMPNPVSVTASGVAIPHPEKVIANSTKGRNTQGFGYAGEDAYFLSRCMSSGVFGMGVADGVYMWRDVGIDSGVMSRALMDSCRLQVQTGESDVLKLLDNAVAGVQAAGIQGSTTLCVLTINLATGLLRSANLGDSGFIVLSPEPQTDPHLEGAYYIKFRCHQLEHSFGCPFQVGHHATADKVDDSEVMTFQVSPKDVVVMGTDGLLDNLGDAELVQEVASMMKQGLTSSQMAQRFTHMAFEASVDKRRTTPYSQCASEAFDMVYSGGKPDDITVLVAVCK